MLRIHDLSKSYGDQVLFEKVGLQMNSGERLGLVGRNGHGKSTLFRLILGEERPDVGTISVPKGYKIGHLAQHIHFTRPTVLEEGCLGLPPGEEDDHYKAERILFGLGFTYVHLIDKTNYLNHYYLVSLLCLLLAFMPLGREASIDARRRRRRGPAPPFRAWMVAILRFQVGAVYFFAGVAKLQSDWLLRAQPLRLWLSRLENLPLVGSVAGEPWAAYLLSWGGALFDLAIPFLLAWSRTRTAAFAALVVFHAATGHSRNDRPSES